MVDSATLVPVNVLAASGSDTSMPSKDVSSSIWLTSLGAAAVVGRVFDQTD